MLRMYGRGPCRLLLAFGGICVSLSVITLYLSSLISINTFALLTIASFFSGVMFIEGGVKYSLLTYISVSILSFLLPVDRMNVIYYIGFFGYFPILKSYIERMKNLPYELIIKTCFYFVVSILGIFVLSGFFMIEIIEKLPVVMVAVIGVIALHIYDYALSILFSFYVRRIRSKIRR